MKKSFLLYLIMSVFLIGYCACDNDEENFDTATTGQVIKVPMISNLLIQLQKKSFSRRIFLSSKTCEAMRRLNSG